MAAERTQTGTWLAMAASGGLLCLIAFLGPAVRQGATDFRSFYAGAKLAGTGHLYSVDHIRSVQSEYADPGELKAFTRPPFYAAFLWPLGKLPYQQAHAIWQLLNLAALAGFILLWAPGALPAILCFWFFPLWVSFASAQDVPFILFTAALGVALLRRNRPFVGGVVFALCAIKAHLFLLLPLLILGNRLWRFGGGLIAGGAVLTGISFAVAGKDWPAQQLKLLKLNESGEASQAFMPNLNGLFHAAPAGNVLLILASLAVVCGAWYAIRRSSLSNSVAVMLAAGLLVGMHGFLYDCTILLPYLLLLCERKGLNSAFPLWSAASISTVTLTKPAISWLGQSALVLLFIWIVRDAAQQLRVRSV